MDAYLASEQSYKNGYAQGYADAIATLDPGRPETSRRGAKYQALMKEAQHHGTATDIIKAIADELSWRVIMRVVHKLRRKRGVEQ